MNQMDFMAMMQADLRQAADLSQYRKVLFVQPHPDDNEVGAGATVAKLAKQGTEIHYLTVTDGSVGTLDPTVSPEKLAETRKQEAEQAGRLLGVRHFHWMNLRDGVGFNDHSFRRALTQVIRQVQPEVVFTVDPWLPYEAHLDHVNVGKAVAHVCLTSGFPNQYQDMTQNGVQPFTPKLLGFYTTHRPNYKWEVDAFWEKKLAALAKHRSQFAGEELQFVSSYLTMKAMQAAEGEDYQLAETFKLLTPRMLHMNVDAEQM